MFFGVLGTPLGSLGAPSAPLGLPWPCKLGVFFRIRFRFDSGAASGATLECSGRVWPPFLNTVARVLKNLLFLMRPFACFQHLMFTLPRKMQVFHCHVQPFACLAHPNAKTHGEIALSFSHVLPFACFQHSQVKITR